MDVKFYEKKGIVMIFWAIFYIPVLVAIYALITRHDQIHNASFCLVLLMLSLFTGAGPIVALCLLFVIRKSLKSQAQQPTNATPIQTNQTTVYPGTTADTLASNITPSATFQITPKKAGTVLGSVIGAVLWISGLVVVGFFVIVTIAVIQCANDPKCM